MREREEDKARAGGRDEGVISWKRSPIKYTGPRHLREARKQKSEGGEPGREGARRRPSQLSLTTPSSIRAGLRGVPCGANSPRRTCDKREREVMAVRGRKERKSMVEEYQGGRRVPQEAPAA